MCDWSIILQVIRTQHSLDMLGSLLCMIERHLGEDVVADMSVSYMVKGMIQNCTKRAIHGAQRTTKPVPLGATKVWHVNVGVLQICNQHQVIVHHHVWKKVVIQYVDETYNETPKKISIKIQVESTHHKYEYLPKV